MEHQLTPASGGADGDFPMLLTDSHSTVTDCAGFDPHHQGDLGVRPGESNPGRMLSAVLLLVLAIVLGLAWWLA